MSATFVADAMAAVLNKLPPSDGVNAAIAIHDLWVDR